MKKSNILITNKVIDSLANDVCIMVDQDQNQALCQELTVLQGHFDFIRSIDTGNLTDQHVAFDIKKTLIDHEAQPLKDIFD